MISPYVRYFGIVTTGYTTLVPFDTKNWPVDTGVLGGI
jgi:hypothetical protein